MYWDLANVEAVLFDMDGTLVDSDAAVRRAWMTWADMYNVDAVQVTDGLHGISADAAVKRLLPHLGDSEVAQSATYQLQLQYDDLSDVAAATGAHKLLDVLAQLSLPWAVVTGADARLAVARLKAAQIDACFLFTRDDVSAGKPDPQGFLDAAHALGVVPEHCLVVEDSLPGLAAGRAAGMAVAMLRGLEGDLMIRDLAQLADLLVSSHVRP